MIDLNRTLLIMAALFSPLFFSACGGGTSPGDGEEEIIVTLPSTYSPDAGRLLGSQCAQCHGTNGISVNEWDSIAGENNLEDEIFADDEPIMNAQAHGYSSEEITLIGDWLKTL